MEAFRKERQHADSYVSDFQRIGTAAPRSAGSNVTAPD